MMANGSCYKRGKARSSEAATGTLEKKFKLSKYQTAVPADQPAGSWHRAFAWIEFGVVWCHAESVGQSDTVNTEPLGQHPDTRDL